MVLIDKFSLFDKFGLFENFSINPIFLNQAQAYEFIASDPDGYVARFNNLDFQARGLININYTDLFNDAVVIPNEIQEQIIIKSIHQVNKLIDTINVNWIDCTKLKNIPWKFIIINTNSIDLGLPHTRFDTIVINQSIINSSYDFINTLLHEKLHVYQKLYPEDFDIYLKSNEFEPHIKYINTNIPYRSNPDTDDWIYIRKGKKYVSRYRYTNPQTIAEVTYSPVNTCDYEHPREKAVYDLLKTI